MDTQPVVADPQLIRSLRMLAGLIARSNGYQARREWKRLLAGIPDAHRLEHHGRKIYSQNEEDGIIEELFRRLHLTPRSGKFIEIGVSNGLECNTHYLLHKHFSGTWIEANENYLCQIRKSFADPLKDGQLQLVPSFATAEDTNILDSYSIIDENIILLSIDIDGNDFWIWKSMTKINPAVVVIEYNAKFPPPLSIVQEYRPDYCWDGTDYFGASICSLVGLARTKGYSLVACNITGINAFFVRDDLVVGQFPYALTAENLYHPCRYHLTDDCFSRVGHPAAFGPYVQV